MGNDVDDSFWEFIKKIMKELRLWDLFLSAGFTPEDEEVLKKIFNNMRLYGFTITMGPNEKPLIKEFGPIKPSTVGSFLGASSMFRDSTVDKDYLLDVYDEGDKVIIIIEAPGSTSVDVVVDSSKHRALIKTNTGTRVAELPAKVEDKPLRISCKNGVCEIVLKKKKTTLF